MTEIQKFNFDSENIRVNIRIKVENGEPWFCASDVCYVLGFSNGRDAISKHCRQKGVAKCDTLTGGGIQNLTYINESNLYRLIMRSKLESAEQFQDWVTETVLPSIRKKRRIYCQTRKENSRRNLS